MTPYDDVLKALNQLLSLVAGRDGAIATNSMADDPLGRISHLISLASRELTEAATSGNSRDMKQAQRKLESLGSLRLLATVLINETEWG
jgi:hypothetical protein